MTATDKRPLRYDECAALLTERYENEPDHGLEYRLEALDIFFDKYWSDFCAPALPAHRVLEAMDDLLVGGPYPTSQDWAAEMLDNMHDDGQTHEWSIGEYIWEHINWDSLTRSLASWYDVRLHEGPEGDVYVFKNPVTFN